MANDNAALAKMDVPRGGMTAFEPGSLQELIGFAEWMASSGLVPTHLRDKPRDIVLVALRGKELGITLMQAMASIYLVEGKLSLSAELWIALVKRHPRCEYFRLVASTDKVATYECKRTGAEPVRLSWTSAQATGAGLMSKGIWQKHTAAMLRARCSAALARAEFPDAALAVVDHDEAEEITGQPSPVVERAYIEQLASSNDPPVPTALAAYRAALLAVEPDERHAAAMAGVWLDHREALTREFAGDVDLLHDAQGEAMALVDGALTAARWKDALDEVAFERAHPAFADFLIAVDMSDMLSGVVAAWRAHRAELAKLPAEVKTLAWKVAHRMVGALDPSIKQPWVWLKSAVENNEPPPPRGGKEPAANDAASDDPDPERDAIEAEAGAGSMAQLEAAASAYLATIDNAAHVANAIAAHDAEYGALGERWVQLGIDRVAAITQGAAGPLTTLASIKNARIKRDERARRDATEARATKPALRRTGT